MYHIKNLNNEDGLTSYNGSEQTDGLKLNNESDLDDQKLSYRKLFNIPSRFKFTETQLNLIKNEHENIFMWFVAVSDRSTSSTSSSEF
ncbi:19261_t:CDS:1, partial [Racocetra persica]